MMQEVVKYDRDSLQLTVPRVLAGGLHPVLWAANKVCEIPTGNVIKLETVGR